MFKQSIAIFSAIICSTAQAAVFINPAPFATADMTVLATVANSSAVNVAGASDFSPVASAQAPGVNIFQFELESAGNSWGGINFVSGLGGGKLNISGTFNFEVAAGYQITNMYGAMAGAYDLSADSKLQASVSLYDGYSSLSNGLELIGGTGAWTSSASFAPYASGTTAISGSFSYYLNGQPDNDTLGYGNIIGLNNFAANYAADGYGPSIFVTVEQITSAVPEPGEWAMMLAGLGLVGAIARRRKKTFVQI